MDSEFLKSEKRLSVARVKCLFHSHNLFGQVHSSPDSYCSTRYCLVGGRQKLSSCTSMTGDICYCPFCGKTRCHRSHSLLGNAIADSVTKSGDETVPKVHAY